MVEMTEEGKVEGVEGRRWGFSGYCKPPSPCPPTHPSPLFSMTPMSAVFKAYYWKLKVFKLPQIFILYLVKFFGEEKISHRLRITKLGVNEDNEMDDNYDDNYDDDDDDDDNDNDDDDDDQYNDPIIL